jgi:DNA (cytosine-5)-methyltransferase 1
MTHGSLFSGIGGFDLAAEWAGWQNLFHCEWNPFGQRVLKHHFPKSISYNDITQTNFTIHRGQVDILTGGFPCQPYSGAGKRLGKEDERHLWPQMLRAIREIQPRWVVGENVLGLVNWSGGLVFHEVQADLEAAGYQVWPYVLPAVSVNAPHRRDRVWFVAYAKNYGCNQRGEEINKWKEHQFQNREKIRNITTTNGKESTTTYPNGNGFNQCGELERRRFGQSNKRTTWHSFPSQSPICGRDDGLPTELDGITFSKWRQESIKAYGNAIVPQVAFEIFSAINEIEKKSGDHSPL